jgi:O-methyltransferase involved in polyketide biosynthesis
MKEASANALIPSLNNLSETLLIPLYFRAKETIGNGIIADYAAIEIVNRLHFDFGKMEKDWKIQTLIAVRTEILDKLVIAFIHSTENPIIVNLGAGLDTRHLRFGRVKWYQLDLEEPIRLRNIFFDNEIHITKSILDFSWVDDIKEKENVLFIIEGVLMYLNEEQVKSIFRAIGANFTNSQIAFDTIPKSFVKTKKHKSINIKSAPLKWGNDQLSEIEEWKYGFKSKIHIPYLSIYKKRWKKYSFLSIFPKIHNGLKISLMRIN